MPTTPTLTVIASSDRRPLLAVAVACGVVVTGLAADFAGVEGPGRSEGALAAALIEDFEPYKHPLRIFVSVLGPAGVAVLATLIAAVGICTGRPRIAVVGLLGPLVTGLATTVLQPLVNRTLDGGPALPSGHTAGITAVATVAALLLRRRYSLGAMTGILVVLLPATVMGLALVVNRLHFPTDTLAGGCLAVAIVIATALATDAVAERLLT